MMRQPRGFTLLEILVALGLMAVLALLSWRGLDAVLGARERLVSASGELGAFSLAFSQLEEDLRRSWSVRLLGLPVPAIGFAMAAADEGGPRMRVTREAPATLAPGAVQRVEWRLRQGRLERGFSAWGPASTSPVQATAPITWQPLVENLRAIELRAFLVGSGWIDASALAARGLPPPALAQPGGPGSGPSDPLAVPVTGVEIVLVRADGSRVQRVFTVRD
jgi:general secretion pathway protein J